MKKNSHFLGFNLIAEDMDWKQSTNCQEDSKSFIKEKVCAVISI